MTLLAQHADGEIHCCDWRSLVDVARDRGGVDALATDTPYSERTHKGHDGADRNDGRGVPARGDATYGHREKTRAIDYAAWSERDVSEFVTAWAPLCRGWFVSITDHHLAPAWAAAMEATGRYVFAPMPIVEVGSRVRLVGDGPSCWTCWLVVSRPSDGAWLNAWRADRRSRGEACALPGAYLFTGHGDRAVMGGKRTDCMRSIVRDYSRPGDVVADPCGGGGTTALACRLEGRRFLYGDMMRSHADIAVERLSVLPTQDRAGTLALFGGAR